MRVVPVICFALATAVAGSMLPAASSYAFTYPSDMPNCASPDGAGNCMANKEQSGNRDRSASIVHSRSAAHAGRSR
jgi:hypothetical protein